MLNRLNIVLLYDDRATFIQTVREHLEAFETHSRHRFWFLPATGQVAGVDGLGAPPDFAMFDAVIVHYTVRLFLEDHISPAIAAAVAAYSGPKILFIQDEYDGVETTRQWIARLGIDTVYTCIPLDQVEKVYPRSRFPAVTFVPTLTGYVPELPDIEQFAQPLEQRRILIGYRGRRLPHQYGALGQEKCRIGVEVKRLAEARGLLVDIEIDDSRRIYGLDWYRFIGSCVATLGTESGANVFDIDGSLRRLSVEHSTLDFDSFAQRYIGEREGWVTMNQISPKIFEAIRLGTALVLFEGRYSDVVQPERHFIPLRKDFSNIGEVFARLEDLPALAAMTRRAYSDVVASGRYSYATLLAGIDADLDRRSADGARARIVAAPILAIEPGGRLARVQPSTASAGVFNDAILPGVLTREHAQAIAAAGAWSGERVDGGPATPATVEQALVALRAEIAVLSARIARPFYTRMAADAWHLLPARIRYSLASTVARALRSSDR